MENLHSILAVRDAQIRARDDEIQALKEQNEFLRAELAASRHDDSKQIGGRGLSANTNTRRVGISNSPVIDLTEDGDEHAEEMDFQQDVRIACAAPSRSSPADTYVYCDSGVSRPSTRLRVKEARKAKLEERANPSNKVEEDEVKDLLAGSPEPSVRTTDDTKQHGNATGSAEAAEVKNDSEPAMRTVISLTDVPEDEIKDFLRSLHHPDVKVKVKGDFSLEHVVYDRLQSMGFAGKLELDLSHATRTFTVKRAWISKNLGGSAQTMLATPAPSKRAVHGYDHFFFVNLKYHPDGPRSQGAPGLIYDYYVWEGDGFPAPARTFVNVSPGNWLYMGEYEVRQAAPLTAQEWLSLPNKTRKTWADAMSTAEWGRSVRIRIAERKRRGTELTAASIDEALASADKYLHVSSEDVHEAFATGEEQISVCCMKALYYDHELAEKLIRWAEDTKENHPLQF